MTHPMISANQKEFYEEEGYLVLKNPNLYDISELQLWTQQVLLWPKETGKWMPYYEINEQGEKQLMRTEKIVDYHDGFRGLLCGDTVLSLLKSLIGKDVVLFKDKINYKLPGAGGFQAHLDAPAYNHIGDIVHTNVMIAMDAQNSENGCVEIVPGSHTMDIPLVGGGSIDPEWESKQNFIKLPLEPGDILIFGSSLAHRSGPNKTASQRAAFFATYNYKEDGTALREKYYAHRRKYFPPDHERTMGEGYDNGWERYAFSAPFTKPVALETTM
ncbi:hypothetical protein TWF694_011209 [Orbilia ellipsospora]|uniref:PhyH-domain-containing protein n=1 Tax=Orbilia ellipsospora TaxID=2528407 RepID=A0AAV9X9M0_9PEZI